jgi:hypothetical protein
MSVHTDLYTALAIMFGERVMMQTHPGFLAIVTIEIPKSTKKRVFLVQRHESDAPGFLCRTIEGVIDHIVATMGERV